MAETIARLSTGDLRVVGVPPYARLAVLEAHPLPDPPVLRIKRADGGHEHWPNRKDLAWKQAYLLAAREQDEALWEYYIASCLPDVRQTTAGAWMETLTLAGVKSRPGETGQLLDWVEYCLLATPDDVAVLKAAFQEANDEQVDRTQARHFLNVTWNGEPIARAADRILGTSPARRSVYYDDLDAAFEWGLKPWEYYSLGKLQRSLLAEYVEVRRLLEALLEHHAWERARKGQGR